MFYGLTGYLKGPTLLTEVRPGPYLSSEKTFFFEKRNTLDKYQDPSLLHYKVEITG